MLFKLHFSHYRYHDICFCLLHNIYCIVRGSEGHPCPGEVPHGDLFLPPHGAVVPGCRGGGGRQQADAELAPQPGKTLTLENTIISTYFELILDILGV